MANMIQMGSNFCAARVYIIHTRPDEIITRDTCASRLLWMTLLEEMAEIRQHCKEVRQLTNSRRFVPGRGHDMEGYYQEKL